MVLNGEFEPMGTRPKQVVVLLGFLEISCYVVICIACLTSVDLLNLNVINQTLVMTSFVMSYRVLRSSSSFAPVYLNESLPREVQSDG